MTNEQLFEILTFEENLESVEILSQEDAGNDATFIRAKLIYPEDEMIVPFVYFSGQDWIFTPCDWQGKLPETFAEIGDIDWRVNDTETEGVIFDGVPMLAPWVQVAAPQENARTRIGQLIREARKKAGLTVRELGDMVGMAHSHIVRIELGKYSVSVDTLDKIGKALGFRITIEYI